VPVCELYAVRDELLARLGPATRALNPRYNDLTCQPRQSLGSEVQQLAMMLAEVEEALDP